jgi:Fe-S cluster assembly scaffold protein SufB
MFYLDSLHDNIKIYVQSHECQSDSKDDRKEDIDRQRLAYLKTIQNEI